MARSYGKRDIFDLIKVLRVITLRSIKNGVDKDKVIERVNELLEVA